MGTHDPMESMLAAALDDSGIRYLSDVRNPSGLDFKLLDSGIEIEVKQFHSDRIAKQMSRVPNVVAVQGATAVAWLADLIRRANR